RSSSPTRRSSDLADEEQERRDENAAAHAEEPREHAHQPADSEQHEGVDRNLRDGQVDLHLVAVSDESARLRPVFPPSRDAVKRLPPQLWGQFAGPAQTRSRKYRRSTGSSLAAASGAMALVCSWLISTSLMPAALLVMTETAASLGPRKRARITSGTVDMPTASGPRVRIARISAGVSNEGPEYQA